MCVQEQRLPKAALASQLQLPAGLQQLMLRTCSSSVLLLLLLPQGSAAADVQAAARMLQLADACAPEPATAAATAAAPGAAGQIAAPEGVPHNPLADKLTQQVRNSNKTSTHDCSYSTIWQCLAAAAAVKPETHIQYS